jgi:hypothetical protein
MKAAYHYRGLPYSVLPDRNGRVIERIFGFGENEFRHLRDVIARELRVSLSSKEETTCVMHASGSDVALPGGGPPRRRENRDGTRLGRALTREMERLIWPGFRPDTIPVLYTWSAAKARAASRLAWRAAAGILPIEGLAESGWSSSADRGAASMGTQLAGRPTARSWSMIR